MSELPDTNKTREDVSTMEKPINKEYATAMETKQTTPGKTSTRFRNPVTALTITRSLDQESNQDGSPPLPASQPVQGELQLLSEQAVPHLPPGPDLHHGQVQGEPQLHMVRHGSLPLPASQYHGHAQDNIRI